MHHLNARAQFEQFAGQMRRRADTGGGEAQRLRVRLGTRNHIGHRCQPALRIGEEDVRRGRQFHQRGEITHHIIGLFLVEARVDHQRAGVHHQRGAVRLGAGDKIAADIAACPRMIFHDEGAVELFPQMSRQHPRQHVRRSAGREAGDDADRTLRIVRSTGKTGRREGNPGHTRRKVTSRYAAGHELLPREAILHQRIAIGFTGEPTAPVIGSAGAINMNS